VRYELDCKYCYKVKPNPTLPEGLAGNAWEPSKRNFLFLTPQHLGSASHCLPPKILTSLSPTQYKECIEMMHKKPGETGKHHGTYLEGSF
jgi:hypothetical protein